MKDTSGRSVPPWPLPSIHPHVPPPEGMLCTCELKAIRMGSTPSWYSEGTGEKPVPMPFCPPQISHNMAWHGTWTSVIGGRQLTALAMARPLKTKINLSYSYWSSPYRAVNTIFLGYTNQPVNAVQESNHSLFWDPYKTHKHNLWAEHRITKWKFVVHEANHSALMC
jgi:hypothetical protein